MSSESYWRANGVGPAGIHHCVHVERGLCGKCWDEYDADPSAYIEFGDHEQGIANWKAEQELIAKSAAESVQHLPCDDPSIPF